MGALIFMLLCAAAEAFLIFALVRFVQEGLRNKRYSAQNSVVVVSGRFANEPLANVKNNNVVPMKAANSGASSPRLRQWVS